MIPRKGLIRVMKDINTYPVLPLPLVPLVGIPNGNSMGNLKGTLTVNPYSNPRPL